MKPPSLLFISHKGFLLHVYSLSRILQRVAHVTA